MATLADLRKKAKAMGIPASAVRGAESSAELQTLMDSYNGTKPRKKSKAVVKKAVAKKVSAPVKKRRGRPLGSTNKPKVEAPKRRGRPPGSKNKPVTKPVARKAVTTKPKRKATGGSAYVSKGTRNILGEIDFNKTKGWNPRLGSAPDTIIKALKKARGNRERAFEILLPDIWDFMGKTKQNGQKRLKDEAHAMLRYRIARTLWDFARQTKQHKIATGRAEYGSNGKTTKPSKPRGRPRGSTTTRKAPQARRKAPVAGQKRRGRPPGSKNRAK